MILKNIQIASKSDENGAPEGPRTSILGSPGEPGPSFWAPLGSIWVPSGPTVPPGSILEDFGRHLGVPFEIKIHKNWC